MQRVVYKLIKRVVSRIRPLLLITHFKVDNVKTASFRTWAHQTTATAVQVQDKVKHLDTLIQQFAKILEEKEVGF